MQTLERLSASQLAAVVGVYRDSLRDHREALNRLNVYPVPDGDTGTNMASTLEAVMAEMAGARTMEQVCRAMSHGSLMGARGNSGVILSQILRALASTFDRLEEAGAGDVARALDAAATAARAAVARPVEGTILTVARAAGDAAVAAGGGLDEVLEAARESAAGALARTPEQLAVLARAGVVDAGGAGYVLLVESFLQVVSGRPVTAPPPPSDAGPVPAPQAQADDPGDLRFEVMFLLEAPDDAVPGFTAAWSALGDSIAVVGGEGLWNCHIHTDEIGPAIEAGLEVGRPRRIQVTDLERQVADERRARPEAPAPGPDQDGTDEAGEGPPARCTVVAVAAGDGLARVFRSLGARRVVAGGQSMNPSTGQLLDAVLSAGSAEVVILPNNANVVAAAAQVGSMTPTVVRVVPTASVAEGLAAMLVHRAEAGADENLAAMVEAASQVVSGEVTRAVRSAATDAGPVEAGDHLGLSGGRVVVSAPSATEAAVALLGELVADGHEVVTIFEGEGSCSSDTDGITSWLAEAHPGVGVEVHHGGQPHYPYLFSLE